MTCLFHEGFAIGRHGQQHCRGPSGSLARASDSASAVLFRDTRLKLGVGHQGCLEGL